MIDPNYAHTHIARSMGNHCDRKAKEFPKHVQQMLSGMNIHFLDTSEAVIMNDIDYIYLDQDGHNSLAVHVFQKVNEMMKIRKQR